MIHGSQQILEPLPDYKRALASGDGVCKPRVGSGAVE